jgi:serine/threonine protein kinase
MVYGNFQMENDTRISYFTAKKSFSKYNFYSHEKSINLYLVNKLNEKTKKNIVNLIGYDDDLKILHLSAIFGKTLDNFIADNSIVGALFSVQFINFILNSVISNLNALHTLGVIHYDIKPSNIIVYQY